MPGSWPFVSLYFNAEECGSFFLAFKFIVPCDTMASFRPSSTYMPENILVIEYEPRYTDRVKQALAGQPVEPSFAHDGEEALRALDSTNPKLIVLSSIVPKANTSDLIHAIRRREH